MALPKFLELYRQLIASPSISSYDEIDDQSNKRLIELLATWLKSLGFMVDISVVPDTRNKFNLFASLGEGTGGLLLAGHTDTVPFDEGRWQSDPFNLLEMNNKLYGLGTADMKGFFAFIIDALRDLDLTKLTKPLYILATADEETTMAGARYFSQSSQLKPDCAIIGEPTELTPIRAHKGHIPSTLQIMGQSGHSSDPDKGINAIELMHDALGRLIELKQDLRDRYHNDAFTIPYPTMNFGQIRGGDAANRICGCCELVMDMRPLPGFSVEALNELLMERLKPLMDQWPGRLKIEHSMPIPGYECPVHQPELQVIEELVGKRAESANYGTEAPYIQQLCPTIILGPGSIAQAHQPNEYLAMDYIEPTRHLLKQLITHFCLAAI